MTKEARNLGSSRVGSSILSVVFSVISIIYVLPIVIVLVNSFKDRREISASPFSVPAGESFVGFDNYINGITSGSYPFYMAVLYSLFITVLSTAVIIVCTSMCAWYITRRRSAMSRLFYTLCIISMVVPFQTVMYTLPQLANLLGLGNPLGIIIIYLGFGAGLAVFMFSGFVKSIPIEIEEAATIDGCTPLRTFFSIVFPVMKPTIVSVAILELMWIWNDYLLPYRVLDLNKYRTIPIQIQYLNAGYGLKDIGAMMAMVIISIIPIVIFYLFAQKSIVRGIIAGAVKG